ncbi:MAG TPA: hypothetical protein EYH34_18275 [Planctomycetes bacterium]|nr:hypothetical protein [Planctomycetota bacterium]
MRDRLLKVYCRLQAALIGEEGTTMAQEGLILAVVVVICIAAWQLLGAKIAGTIFAVASAI